MPAGDAEAAKIDTSETIMCVCDRAFMTTRTSSAAPVTGTSTSGAPLDGAGTVTRSPWTHSPPRRR